MSSLEQRATAEGISVKRPLVALMVGSLAVAELAPENSVLKYVAGGIGLISSVALAASFERSEKSQLSDPPLHFLDRSGQL